MKKNGPHYPVPHDPVTMVGRDVGSIPEPSPTRGPFDPGIFFRRINHHHLRMPR